MNGCFKKALQQFNAGGLPEVLEGPQSPQKEGPRKHKNWDGGKLDFDDIMSRQLQPVPTEVSIMSKHIVPVVVLFT